MPVKRHQQGLREMGMLEPGGMELALRKERVYPASGGKASRQRFSQSCGITCGCRQARLSPPAGCFAPRHEQVVTLHKAQC